MNLKNIKKFFLNLILFFENKLKVWFSFLISVEQNGLRDDNNNFKINKKFKIIKNFYYFTTNIKPKYIKKFLILKSQVNR